MNLIDRIRALVTSIGADIKELQKKDWTFYATIWSAKPTLHTTLPNGKVYQYTLEGITRYRFVPTIYNPTQDAFYSNFDGVNLTNLITKKG